MDTSAIPFIWADVPGHAAFLLIAISYYLTNIYWLRVIAVIGLSLEIVYFNLAGGAMHAGIAWDVIFIAINLWQIYWLVDEKRKFRKVQDAHLLRQGVFAGFTDGQLARLVTSGYWKDLDPGTVLTHQGQDVAALTLICDGHAIVDVGGNIVAQLTNGAFVGEMAFVTGKPASATVIVEQPTRAFVFEMAKLRKLVDTDESVAMAINRVIGRDLASKLQHRNDVRTGAA
jgi:hypothetical protein